MSNLPAFLLNNETVSLADADPTESLLRWLKRHRLRGTKEGCADGDCGACTVALLEVEKNGQAQYKAVNSCLLPIGALPGRELLTVEGLTPDSALHSVQQIMVDCGGSQCGYCTPGFVMSLFVASLNGELTDSATEGNLCRCTGYKPIRAATAMLKNKKFQSDQFCNLPNTTHTPLAGAALGKFFSPASIEEAVELKAQHPQSLWISGATDLGVALSHGKNIASAFIALDRIAELKTIEISAVTVTIGAGVVLSDIETKLSGIFPALDQMLPWFAARQVRNRATLGGNLGSASPIGDLLPVLLALDATIHCRGPLGSRQIPISDYFLDYRKTALANDELIVSVVLPRNSEIIQGAYKVAKRQTDDISIVAAVFALALDQNLCVKHVRLAYGGVAATPIRAAKAEAYLMGRRLDEMTIAKTSEILETEFSPLSDHRSSADYRRKLCSNLFKKFVAEHWQ